MRTGCSRAAIRLKFNILNVWLLSTVCEQFSSGNFASTRKRQNRFLRCIERLVGTLKRKIFRFSLNFLHFITGIFLQKRFSVSIVFVSINFVKVVQTWLVYRMRDLPLFRQGIMFKPVIFLSITHLFRQRFFSNSCEKNPLPAPYEYTKVQVEQSTGDCNLLFYSCTNLHDFRPTLFFTTDK